MFAEKIKESLEISLQTTYLDKFGLVYEFLSLTLFLGQQDKGLAGFHAVSSRLHDFVACAELVEQPVYQVAAVFQKIAIRRVAYLRIAACRINLHCAAMIISFLINVFLLRLAAVRFRQHQGQHIEEVMVKPLADQHEQLRHEHRFFRELRKSQQILHVWVLLNCLNGLLVA